MPFWYLHAYTKLKVTIKNQGLEAPKFVKNLKYKYY